MSSKWLSEKTRRRWPIETELYSPSTKFHSDIRSLLLAQPNSQAKSHFRSTLPHASQRQMKGEMDGWMHGWIDGRQTDHTPAHPHTHTLSLSDEDVRREVASQMACCPWHSLECHHLHAAPHTAMSPLPWPLLSTAMCDSWNQCSSSLLVPSSRPQWCGTPRRRCQGHKWPWGKWTRWWADMSLVQEPQNGKFSIKKDGITLGLQKYTGSRCSSHPCCHPDHISPTWLWGLLSSSWWPSPGWSQHRKPAAHEITHQGTTAD